MATEINEKSTKNQILQAYNEALTKLKEQKTEDRKAEKKKEEDIKTLKSASENSIEKIVNSIGSTKIEILNFLDEVGEKLSAEFKKLEEIKKAIDIEEKYLEDIYEIKANADSLSVLLQVQKDKKANFETEMESKRNDFDEEMSLKKIQWKQEQELYENAKKERDAQLKKERQREDEEYNYNLKLNRKKDSDKYSEEKALLEKELIDKRAIFEKELNDRETVIESKEKELAALTLKVEQFPKELETALKENEKFIVERIEFKYKHQMEITQKEIEGERNLNKQLVQSLENKIKEQAEHIKQLTQKVNESGQQVQTIAIKAIEGASTQRILSSNYEKVSEQLAKGKE